MLLSILLKLTGYFLLVCFVLFLLGLPFIGILLKVKSLQGIKSIFLSMLFGFYSLFIVYFLTGLTAMINPRISTVLLENLNIIISVAIAVIIAISTTILSKELNNLRDSIKREIKKFNIHWCNYLSIFLFIFIILNIPELAGETFLSYIGDVSFHHAYFNSLLSGKIPPFVNSVGCNVNRYPYFYHFLLASFSSLLNMPFGLTMKIFQFIQAFCFIIATFFTLSHFLKRQLPLLATLVLICLGGGFGWINIALSKDIGEFVLPIGIDYFEHSEELLWDMAYTKSYLPSQHILPPAYPRDLGFVFFMLFLGSITQSYIHFKQSNILNKELTVILTLISLNVGIQIALHTQISVASLAVFLTIILLYHIHSIKRRNAPLIFFSMLPVILNLHWGLHLLGNSMKYGGLVEWEIRFLLQKPFPFSYILPSLGFPLILGIMGVIFSQTITNKHVYEGVKVLNIVFIIINCIIALNISGLHIPILVSPDGKDVSRYTVLIFCVLGIYSGIFLDKITERYKRNLVTIFIIMMIVFASMSTLISSVGLYNLLRQNSPPRQFPQFSKIMNIGLNESIFILSKPLSIVTTYNPDVVTFPTSPSYCRIVYRDLMQEFAEAYFARISLLNYIKVGDKHQVEILLDYLVEKYNTSYMLVYGAQYKKLNSFKLIEENVTIIRHSKGNYYLVKLSKKA
jgi:hypothetical protein